jgi:hypothetical protein
MGLFSLIDPPTDDDRCSEAEYVELVRDAYSQIDYPWHRLIPGLRDRGRAAVEVRWARPNPPGAVGTYTSSLNLITLGYQFGPSGMPSTFVHEVGHAVDDLTLTDVQRQRITAFWHGLRCQYHWPEVADPNDPTRPHPWAHEVWHYETWRSNSAEYLFRHNEAYADAFVAAFAPTIWDTRGVYGRFVHWPTDYAVVPAVSHYDRIRELTLEEPIMAFTDVPATHPHREGIEWAAGEGIVTGYADGTFKPEATVNRGQLCTMLKRYDDRA